jgi:two-component system chemotaxis sensor kinase CheA
VTVSSSDPKDVFRQEAQDLLAQLEAVLLDLERRPDDIALIDSAFRALHTIKGSGSMFGFEAVAAFTHHVETAFDRVRKGSVAPSRDLIATALLAQDHMRVLIESPDDEDKVSGNAILAALQSILDAAVAPVSPLPSAATPEKATWRIRIRLPRDVMANGTNPLLLIDELRELGTASVTALTGDIPALAEIDPTACYLGWDVVLSTSQPRSAIEDVFIFVRDEMMLEIEPIDIDGPDRRIGEILTELDYVTADAVDAALAKQESLGQILIKAGATSPDKLASALSEQQHQREQAAHKSVATASIRVPAERLDELMDRVGELVIAQSRLRQITKASVDPQMTSVAEEIERLVLELRDTTMGIRMVPIGSLFGRFRRVVHDLSRDLGKHVELAMEGEETELDKTVIEQLNDPLVHLIRNAIDHGIEDPAVRLAAGKPRDGRILLSARHAGTEVFITVHDDGRGLDRDRIRKRAVERGLLPADIDIADADLFQVLFQPGFSTVEKVTNLSGRGVGMDVVKRTVEALRSKIDMSSPPGGGTSVTLRLPLTLAIIDGLLVRIGNGRYVLPLGAVEECVELTAAADAQSRGRSFLNIRGELVPFMRLRELFAAKTPANEFQKVVVVSSGDLKVGLVVDQVIGDHQTVIKSLSKLHSDIAMFSGATILGDGTVAMILDVPHLVEFGQVREERMKVAV